MVRIIYLDFEICIWLFVDYDAGHFDQFFFHFYQVEIKKYSGRRSPKGVRPR